MSFQVLGKKPDIADGDDNDDIAADISNRKIAKLYMVGLFTSCTTTQNIQIQIHRCIFTIKPQHNKMMFFIRYLMPVEK